MKTKYNPAFIVVGILVALGVGANAGNARPGEGIPNLLLVGLAVLSVGYGLHLRQLAKKGIEETTRPAAIMKTQSRKK